LRQRIDTLERQLLQAQQDAKFQTMQTQMASMFNDMKNEMAALRQAVQTPNGHAPVTNPIQDAIALSNSIVASRDSPLQVGLSLADRLAAAREGTPSTELGARYALAKLEKEETMSIERTKQESG